MIDQPSGPSMDPSLLGGDKLSGAAVGRLSLYLRELQGLAAAEVKSVNSAKLGKLVDVSAAVVRRDLSSLGAIGRRGVGYQVEHLIDAIGGVLGSGRQWTVVLVGVGSLGSALLRYRGFEPFGFQISDAFDSNPQRIGRRVGGLVVQDVANMPTRLKEVKVNLAVLAVPSEHAAEVAQKLANGGVEGILNFAPSTLKLSPSIAVVNVDLGGELQRLAFAVQNHHS